MKSRARLGSHPLHPVLIVFPIAFLSATVATHLIGWWFHKPSFLYISYILNLAGVLWGLVAAIPGLIDLVHTVPPQSSAKKRGVKHGIANTVMLLLFAAAWFYRRSDAVNNYLLLGLEVCGLALMSFAGWLGGTLVYRNQIGVDIRYANAGKWQESYLDAESGSILVAQPEDLKVNSMKLIHLKNKRVVLARTETGFVAFDDRCPHRGGSLAGGSIMCGTVQCSWHGSQFNVQTGEVKEGPAKEGIKTYKVEIREGSVYLLI